MAADLLPLFSYFPRLNDAQRASLVALYDLYADWNAKINVVSRQDISNLYERHVLHSLAVAAFVDERLDGWRDGPCIIDVGTGGGFPGIPLAIVYPQCRFLLIDRVGKKVRVAGEVARAIGLTNVEVRQAAVEEVSDTCDYAVSRAVMPMASLVKAVRRCAPRALICLKGGDLGEELAPAACRRAEVVEVARYFHEPFFETKRVVYLPLR